MATKPKDSSRVVGNEKKKIPSSSSPLTTAKRTIKPSTTTTTTTSTTNKSNSITPSEKNKPTTSSRKPKTETPIKPTPIRRRSLDKPLSSSNLTVKTTQPSSSRLQNALASPGPIRSSNPQVKSTTLSKPNSDKTPGDAKTKLVWKKATKKINTPTSNTTKKGVSDHASSANPTKTRITDSHSSNVEIVDVNEVTDQEAEVINVENKEHASNVISPDVNSEFVHEHEHDQVLKDSDQPQNGDDEKVFSTVSEEEITEKEPQEKPEVDHEEKQTNSENHPGEVDHSEVEREVAVNEKEENESGIVMEDQKSENNSENHQKEVDHSEVEREAAVNEKEENESGIVIEDQKSENNEEKPEVEHEEKENNSENHQEEVDHSEVEREAAANEKEENECGIVIEDKKSENNNEEERGGEGKEAVEGGVSEKVEEAKTEVAQPKQQLAAKGKNESQAKGKNESQVSNDMIEETASKLLGRRNKVLALAGAFQTVIDHQNK